MVASSDGAREALASISGSNLCLMSEASMKAQLMLLFTTPTRDLAVIRKAKRNIDHHLLME